MKYSDVKFIDIIKHATSYGARLMGDDFIGYKFVGDDSEFWNGLVMRCDVEDLADTVGACNFAKNGIEFVPYDSDVWGKY